MATKKLILGRYQRLFVKTDATKLFDLQFEGVVNENSIELTQSVDSEQIDTKANGGEKVSLPGVKTYTMSVTIDQVYEDAGMDTLLEALNEVITLQVRNVPDTGDATVYVEGDFLVKEIKDTANAKGVAQIQVSLEGAGGVTINRPARVLKTA